MCQWIYLEINQAQTNSIYAMCEAIEVIYFIVTVSVTSCNLDMV